jgi:exopolysaccharide production protein ExoZ
LILTTLRVRLAPLATHGGAAMRYNSVQVLRGLAASAVVIGHSASFTGVPNAVGVLGYAGVDVFFVISGFIICQVATRDRSAWSFIGRRFWRIFPIYWIVLAFSLAINASGISTAAPGMGWQPSYEYFFLLTTANRFVPPAWTLVFELYFYIAVAVILLLARNWFYPVLAIWMLAQAVSAALFGQTGGPTANIIVLEFGLGCAIAWLVSKDVLKFPIAALTLGIIPFAIGDFISLQAGHPTFVERFFTFGLGSALIMYALIAFEHRKALTFPRPLIALGDASYSLYLWHWPLIRVAVALSLGWITVPLIFAIAFVSYYAMEAPLLRWRFQRLRVGLGTVGAADHI